MSEGKTEPKCKSVTLYLDIEVIEKLNAAAEVTHRSKSNAANHFILHGIANYDFKTAAPRKVATPKKATKVNTRVKKPAEIKAPVARKTRGQKVPVVTNEQSAPKKRRTRRKSPAASAEKQAA